MSKSILEISKTYSPKEIQELFERKKEDIYNSLMARLEVFHKEYFYLKEGGRIDRFKNRTHFENNKLYQLYEWKEYRENNNIIETNYFKDKLIESFFYGRIDFEKHIFEEKEIVYYYIIDEYYGERLRQKALEIYERRKEKCVDKKWVIDQLFEPDIKEIAIMLGKAAGYSKFHSYCYNRREEINKKEEIKKDGKGNRLIEAKLPNFKTRLKGDNMTSLSQKQTSVLFYYMMQTKIILNDKTLQSKQEIAKVIQVLTGYSKKTIADNLNKNTLSSLNSEEIKELQKKIKDLNSLIMKEINKDMNK